MKQSVPKILFQLAILMMLPALLFGQHSDYVRTSGHQFTLSGRPYYFIGANYWYGGYLMLNKNVELNRERLHTELDFLKANGVTNLRVLAATEGSGYVNGVYRTAPATQPSKGVFKKEQLDGLDYLLNEMDKRNMKAVLFLSNNWEWSGGFLQYLNWNGLIPDSILIRKLNWDEHRDYVSKFYSCDACKEDYRKQVDLLLSRVNKYSGKKYTEDPTIMSWELANEPRPMRPAANKAYAEWIAFTAAYIKSKDKNHLVTIGSEGQMGTENMDLFKQNHADKNIDYLTIHIWPKNWGWFKDTAIQQSFENIINNTDNYIRNHKAIAGEMNKPMVIEEFGLPRDNHVYDMRSTTFLRDNYYKYIFDFVKESAANDGVIAGCNFWAVGGEARPIEGQVFWKTGDDYMGDPTGEEQGLNSVFNSDSTTWKLIRDYTGTLKKMPAGKPYLASDSLATAETKALYRNLAKLVDKGTMIGHQDALAYGVGWKYVPDKSDVKELTGDYPAVFGWELGNLEHDLPHNLDSVPFGRMKNFIKDVYKKGGVNTISWHLDNPINNESAWDTTHGGVNEILPGGSRNELYQVWLNRLADFMLDLKGERGELIPILFRPYHELTGNWFWWCRNTCTPAEFKLLWRYTVDFLRNNRKVHNLLYVYNTADFFTQDEFLERYPGDDVVDMVSFDAYQYNDPVVDSSFLKTTRQKMQMAAKVAAQKHKLAALAEAGFERIPYAEWWTKTLWPAVKDYKVSYVLLWRNAGLMPGGKMHYYIPQKNDVSAKDFVEFYRKDATLFLQQVATEKLYQ